MKMLKKVVRISEYTNNTSNPDVNLTAREIEVLKLNAEGLINI